MNAGVGRGGADAETRALGMALFLVSLTMLFAACIAGYLVVRFRAESWPPPGSPALPFTIWTSTALVLGVSVAVQRALGAVRSGALPALQRRLGLAMLLALLFLASQAWTWLRVVGAPSFREHLWGFGFLMLTGLHGAHVLGGLVALGVVLWLARRGAYGPATHAGVRNTVIYWHYLAGVWLVLLGLLLTG